MRVLVTGGAGYIGSVVVEELVASGAEAVVVLDDLSTGHEGAVSAPAELVQGTIADRDLVERVCRRYGIDAVIHMAARSLVGASMAHPASYYRANVSGSLALLEAVLVAGVRRFVFSSSAAVYGEPGVATITEDLPPEPTNVYGETKLVFERALGWFGRIHGMTTVSLRYFNAAGATPRNGEDHDPESHLIPVVLAAARDGHEVPVFGQDYPTLDGTCVRDYIHVSDLARAHVLALGAEASAAYNLGGGGGYSVRQVIAACERVTGARVRTRAMPRRAGDPAVLVASSERIQNALGWRPQKPDLDAIVADAWAWRRAHADGYAAGRSAARA